MGNKNNETKRYNSSKVNKKSKKNNRTVKNKKNKKLGKIIKIIIILLLILLIIGSGILVGAFFGMFGDELTISKEDLVIPYENSTVYDKDGNLIATLSGGTKRKCISLSEMGEFLPKAYVAIEDERFYDHRGVDIKRTAAATLTFITNRGDSSFGGSTITQQLVKNITNDKEDSKLAGVVRKVKEMSKAIQVEQYMSKHQILELYLNLIFIGGNDINGVYLGSIYYFNKEPKDLSIAECAFMAGINHSPNAYNPFKKEDSEEKTTKKQESIKKRTKTVLRKMKELGNINQEQYDSAVAEVDSGLKFENGDTSPTIEVSYVVEAALAQIKEQLMQQGKSESLAETYLYSGGLKIYTTQDTSVQTVLEETLKQDKYFTSTKVKKKDENGKEYKETVMSMPTMVIVDHKTGDVVAASSAIGEKGQRVTSTKIGYFNVPTKLRKSTGSSMKPISVIAPGLETGTITASTVYIDAKTTFDTHDKYTPKNYYSGYKGPMTMRNAIEISANIPHVKALADIGVEKSKEFCESVGLPRFEKEQLTLALGGLSKGVTLTEMAGAYSAIANDGTYIEPTFYKYVTDKEDNVVIKPDQATNKVMSDQNAYIEKSILTEPVVGANGTAKYCAIKGMDVAAKTGTTNDDYDRWLCGFTPYYTAVCWYGYETNATVSYSGNPAGKIWDEVMTKIHENLPAAEFIRPEGIVEVTVCKATGLKASTGCSSVYTEVFTEDSVPEECGGHKMAMVCTQTNLLCCEGCPFGEYRYYNTLPPKEKDASWASGASNTDSAPTEVCPHTPSPLHQAVPVTPPTETTTPSTTEPTPQPTTPTVPEPTPTTPTTVPNTPSVPETTTPSVPTNTPTTPTVPETTPTEETTTQPTTPTGTETTPSV